MLYFLYVNECIVNMKKVVNSSFNIYILNHVDSWGFVPVICTISSRSCVVMAEGHLFTMTEGAMSSLVKAAFVVYHMVKH